MGYDAVQCCGRMRTFRGTMLSPSSGWSNCRVSRFTFDLGTSLIRTRFASIKRHLVPVLYSHHLLYLAICFDDITLYEYANILKFSTFFFFFSVGEVCSIR